MKASELDPAMRVLKREVAKMNPAVVGVVAETPFEVLISTLLSLRTQDATTDAASRRLFARARTPRAMLRLPLAALRKLIYPVSFYRVKAGRIHEICRILLSRYGGSVPSELDQLLELPGVGRKTANLVVTVGYAKPGICVDIHVHRITNRWGYVKTKGPDETEMALRAKLPKKYWGLLNDLLVPYGQNLCRPLSPWCSRCKLTVWCDRVGVGRTR
jgi:endonuclease III